MCNSLFQISTGTIKAQLSQLDLPEALNNTPGSDGEEIFEPSNELHVSDILDGSIQVDISHEGGEFLQILLEDVDDNPKQRERKYKERRTRRDRLERRQEGFRLQLDVITDAFMRWEASLGPGGLQNASPPSPPDEPLANGPRLQIVDVFGTSFHLSSKLMLTLLYG